MRFQEYLRQKASNLGEPEEIVRKAYNSWCIYQEVIKTKYVVRSGYSLYGITQPNILSDASQSVSEHQNLVYVLVDAISSYFPQLFLVGDWEKIKTAASYHDMGESVTGDIPDDGTMQHETKYQLEERELLRFFQYFGDDRSEVLELIKAKSHLVETDNSEWHFKCSRRSARFLHLADKLSALLDLCFFELQGNPGSLENKRVVSFPTERDIRASEATGSWRPLDIWTYSFVKISQIRSGFDFDGIFEAILRVAVADARMLGPTSQRNVAEYSPPNTTIIQLVLTEEVFPWWQKVVSDNAGE